MTARVVYTHRARGQLFSLYHHIRQDASALTAQRFVDSVVQQCETLNVFPNRGVSREDIRPGLRTIAFRRVLIAYFVDNASVEHGPVTITGLFYGGQDYETILADVDAP